MTPRVSDATSSPVGAARVASTVVWIPPACVRLPGHARRELVAAIAGEHEMRVAVDETRDHAASPGVDAFVGGRARRLDGADALAVDHHRRVAADPERPVAERRVVGDEQPDVVDRRCHATARSSTR